MTHVTGELAAAGAPVRPGSPGRTVAPAERGALRIADRVVSKIAAQAAREALDVLPPDAGPPHATVVVRPHSRLRSSGGTPIDTARVRIGLELDYPSDIGAQCAAVRRQVTQRVRMLAGMEVSEVAVQVERLHSAQARGAAQGRTQ
ncbi:hypothetical protein GCM10010094_54990 [Streptomyces flaveus]|uniref:Asp23/Gls24 family envelope stress response protein n=1 Tax=Streptomyces flaveus TaxID=66370 RepID=A0A917R2T8_9ACTN|nr:hypothetical protein GCM10010094_54990 [Streptomyces flaveus]